MKKKKVLTAIYQSLIAVLLFNTMSEETHHGFVDKHLLNAACFFFQTIRFQMQPERLISQEAFPFVCTMIHSSILFLHIFKIKHFFSFLFF